VLHAISQELGIHATVNISFMIVMQSTDIIPYQQFQHCKDCAWAYSMVDVNWRVDVVCAVILLPLKFIPIMKY
jgi:hypothetical protein